MKTNETIEAKGTVCFPLKLMFVAELFSKLSNKEQDYIVSQIEALLSHEQ